MPSLIIRPRITILELFPCLQKTIKNGHTDRQGSRHGKALEKISPSSTTITCLMHTFCTQNVTVTGTCGVFQVSRVKFFERREEEGEKLEEIHEIPILTWKNVAEMIDWKRKRVTAEKLKKFSTLQMTSENDRGKGLSLLRAFWLH